MQHLYGFLSMCHFDCKVSDEAGCVTAFCQITSPSLAPEDVALPPITTPTYAIEFQKANQASSRGRDGLTAQLGRDLLASGQQINCITLHLVGYIYIYIYIHIHIYIYIEYELRILKK